MDDQGIDLCCSLRFLALSNEQAERLSQLSLGASFGKHFKTKSITSSVELSESAIPVLQEFIVINGIDATTTDIFISVLTEYDTRIIDVPNYVNKAVIAIGSNIVFSFTYAQ